MATSRPVPPAEYSTYPLEKLCTLWGRGELTEEQMIGHLLQHLLELENRLRRLEQAPSNPVRSAEDSSRQ